MYFCSNEGLTPWPATVRVLGQWISARSFGGSSSELGQIQPDTIEHYLNDLRSYQVDSGLGIDVFSSPHLKRMIKGAGRLFNGAQPRERRPIMKKTLTRICSQPSLEPSTKLTKNSLNFDTAFKVAFAGFMRLGEFTYTKQQPTKPHTFKETKLTRRDIKICEGGRYATLLLRRSKADYKHKGVTILLTATGDGTCPVTGLARLLKEDPQPPTTPLIRILQPLRNPRGTRPTPTPSRCPTRRLPRP